MMTNISNPIRRALGRAGVIAAFGVLAGFALVACDSPGGDGGGGGGGGGSCAVEGQVICNGQASQRCTNGTWLTQFTCGPSETCSSGVCEIGNQNNTCAGRVCGPDGRGGQCGTCAVGQTCDANGQCGGGTCTPQCGGRQCGADGCGGQCGTCGFGQTCDANGLCGGGSCTPQCGGRQCGTDGCGGQCGTCGFGQTCNANGVCGGGSCTPQCGGRQCGADGCGGQCGTCGGGQTCDANGQCGGGQAGGGDCNAILGCVYGQTGCAATAQSQDQFNQCEQACLAQGGTQGKAEYAALINCSGGCQNADQAAYNRCMYTNCAPAEVACYYAVTGNSGCAQVAQCASACQDANCYNACFEGGTANGQAALYALNYCIDVACGPDYTEQCVQQAYQATCLTQATACQNN